MKCYKQLIFNSIAIFLLFCACKNQQSQNEKVKESFNQTKKIILQKSGNDFEIPTKVYEIRDYVRQNGQAKQGYVGGRIFKNLERRLPILDPSKNRIKYQEWDVNPKRKKQNRGKERLVTGNDNNDYYTNNHYKTFLKLQAND